MQITRKQAWTALGIIFSANFLNYLDRQLVSALERPVTQALQLSGTEFGLLWTLFTVGYIMSAPAVGFLTDRYSRTKVFAACILIWSLATISSGMAQTKLLLYVSRFFIGTGEAGCLIIGPSLISEFFDRRVRGRALSVFYLGLPLGGTAGYMVGGFFEKFFTWRTAFLCAGLPGILVALVVWMLREPPRGLVEGQEAPQKLKGLRPYLDLLKTKTLMYIIFAEAFAVMILVPLLHFGKAFFQEARGFDPLQASLTLGIVALVAGVLGNLTSGLLGDRLARRRPGAYSLIAGFGYLLGMPCIIGSFFVPTGWLFLLLLLLGCYFYFMCMPAVNTQIANVTHPNQRAMAYALAVFTLHFLGDMLTPPVFGTVSDSLARKHDPVTVNRVRVHFPADSVERGPIERFTLQYKSYESNAGNHAHDESHERWTPVFVRATNADASAGWFTARSRIVDFEIDPVSTTRIRYLQDAQGGPPNHPRRAKLVELQVFDGSVERPALRAEVDSGEGAAWIVDGDLTGREAWQSEESDKKHFANAVFGFPGKGRRFAFLFFSFAMIVSGFVCFLAYRHAAKDAARVAEAITKTHERPS